MGQRRCARPLAAVALACGGLVQADGKIRVIVAGLPNTGTQSMVWGLKYLGYTATHGTHLSYNETIRQAFDDWLFRGQSFEPAVNTLLDNGFDALTDVPMMLSWQAMAARYPESKVILTLRDSAEQWYDSFAGKQHWQHITGIGWLLVRWFYFYWRTDFFALMESFNRYDQTYGCNWKLEQTPELKRSCVEGYNAHNALVQQEIPAERLLVFNVKDGWPPLCKFLGHPEPARRFPRVDYTKQHEDIPTEDRVEEGRKFWEPFIVLGLFLLVLLCGLCCALARCCCWKLRSTARMPAEDRKER